MSDYGPCNRSCGWVFGQHTDAAKRISDATILAWTVEGWASVGKWMSFSLEEGKGDNVLYPNKRECVRHVSNEFLYMYTKLQPAGMPVCASEIMLSFTREAYKKGFRLADPDSMNGGRDIIPRIGTVEALDQLIALQRGK
jgi:hypothetical protein